MDMQARNSITNINRPLEINSNKVYINPNFSTYRATYTALPENTSMHFNPKFSSQAPHSNKNTNNTRIFINPNFVKLAQGHHTSSEPLQIIPLCNNVKKSIENNIEQKKIELNLPNVNVNKSRYSLVRHGTVKVKETVKNKLLNYPTKPSKTIKINKYKSVSLSDIKNRLMKENNSVQVSPNLRNIKVLPQSQEYGTHPGHIKKIINRYKYVKFKSTSVSFDSNKRVIKNKPNVAAVKKNYKIKEAKKVFKKNNIPCRLFKKFGKCIRNIHGNCEFLHDKNHVALCRKFLKGICCNTECLLSHEVTNEKMPTCHFYLKGMCTKENCPYVHIKLNDNTRICPEFLKGYCEKGNKCTDRHVAVESDTKKPYMRNKKLKLRKKSICLENKPKADNKLNDIKEEENITEGRYYEDQVKWDENTNDEVIKPTRCKLGSLPSFIQLHN